jgi:hypothetical protein
VPEPIDITPGRPIPPADPVAARRRRWIRLLGAGAVASVLAGGAGYAALNEPGVRRVTVLPAVPAPVVPMGSDLPTVEAVPRGASVVRSPAGSAKPAPGVKAGRTPPAEPATPAASPAQPREEETQPPEEETQPPDEQAQPRGGQAQPREEQAALTARYSGGGRWRPGGLHGYRGSVSVSGSGEQGWRVRLTVPGGNRVRAGGNVTVRQDGERVVFTPSRDGAADFHFWITGLLPAEPYDCLVNGHACG